LLVTFSLSLCFSLSLSLCLPLSISLELSLYIYLLWLRPTLFVCICLFVQLSHVRITCWLRVLTRTPFHCATSLVCSQVLTSRVGFRLSCDIYTWVLRILVSMRARWLSYIKRVESSALAVLICSGGEYRSVMQHTETARKMYRSAMQHTETVSLAFYSHY
jgi:hypothetical protein